MGGRSWRPCALAVGVVAGLFARRMLVAKSVNTAEVRAAQLVSDAEHEAEVKVRQALLEVRDEISGMRQEAEEDVRVRREELRRNEDRLAKREEQADDAPRGRRQAGEGPGAHRPRAAVDASGHRAGRLPGAPGARARRPR